ncbi:MAG: DUF3667 domain-containing protein [Planctomycetes bacterium]|nr:DUF3667 domain-containing protein [Planctomycetota bacterium]
MTPSEPSDCPNCGVASAVGGSFCPSCGQDNARPRLEARAVLLDALHNFVGWESALARTLRGLVTGPGRMVNAYVAGRRRAYVNPARFCLLSLALWFFATRAVGLDPLDSSGVRFDATGSEGAQHVAAEVRNLLQRHLDLLMYLSLPILALALRGLFRRRERNLAECLVLVLYLAGFRYLVTAALAPVQATLGFGQVLGRVVAGPLWLTWAARDFFGTAWWGSLWRTLVAMLLHMLGTVLLFGAVVVPWVLLGGA